MLPFGEKRTHHIHIFEPSSRHWKGKIFFRDYLISHSDTAQEYKQLKIQLAQQHTYDREQYTDEKTKFINDILQKTSVWPVQGSVVETVHFNVKERLNLTIAALSRRDNEEARLLYKTCPKYRYLATDYEFTQRFAAITWIGEKYAELCQYFYDKMLLAQAVISAVALSNDPTLEDKLSYSMSDMQNTRIGHISTLKSIHKALIEFCDDAGIDCNQLIQWMSPPEGRSHINECLMLEGVEPDKEFTTYTKNKFLSTWEALCDLR